MYAGKPCGYRGASAAAAPGRSGRRDTTGTRLGGIGRMPACPARRRESLLRWCASTRRALEQERTQQSCHRFCGLRSDGEPIPGGARPGRQAEHRRSKHKQPPTPPCAAPPGALHQELRRVAAEDAPDALEVQADVLVAVLGCCAPATQCPTTHRLPRRRGRHDRRLGATPNAPGSGS